MKINISKVYFLTILSALYIFTPNTQAQDSLYLVGTITGESYENRITNVNRIGDVNGDGYDDFMVASRTGKARKDQGVVQLYLGSSTLDLTPDVTFHYPCCDTLNNLGNANEIGDINGDGYDDFTISGFFGDFGFAKGKVFLFYGGETVDTVPVAEFYEPWIQDSFGDVVEKIGDINKDGYGDFIICSSYNWSSARGYAYLFWGGDTITWERSTTFTSDTLEDFFGTSAANIGDINNDGFEDIAISATAWLGQDDTSKVYIFYGGKPMDTEADTILTANNGIKEIGQVIKRCGDLNNDGTIDFIIGSWDSILLYLSIDSSITLNGYPLIGADGDINKDGFSDFVIIGPNYQNSDDNANYATYVHLGKENIDTNYTYKLLEDLQYAAPADIFFEDLNGDHFDEILFVRPAYPVYENPFGKIYIYSYKKLTDAKDIEENVLKDFELKQNYPNPFNPETKISFTIPNVTLSPDKIGEGSRVQLRVFDVLGKEVATLVNEYKGAGTYEVNFNASKLSSGIYYYQLKAGSFIETKKMILLK